MGSKGWVRSKAWIWLFSSTHRTSARSGGFRYSPTMSRTFSMNSGSFDSLNVSVRCGCSAKARHDTIDAAVPATLDVHLILDNYGTHKTPMIHRWLARHPRFHLHFTPTSASWLNLVERWFALLSDKQIKRGAHASTRALETAILAYIAFSNNSPKPFVWAKTADEILASVARFCHRISGSGH